MPTSKNDWEKRIRFLETYQQAWRSQAELDEQLYELRWAMDGIPDNIPITMPSTARAVVDEATDHSDFDPRWMKVHTPTYGLGDDASERSSRLRAFLPGWLLYQVTYSNDVSPIRDYIKNMHIYGKAVLKVFYAKEEWPEAEILEGMTEDDARQVRERVEKEREFTMPVVMRSIHPLAVYEDPSIGAKKWAAEVYEHTPLEVRGLYENWMPASIDEDEMYNADARVRVLDCYEVGKDESGTPGIWHQVLIDEAEGADYSEATPAVFLPHEPFPYIIRYSGYGRQTGRYEEKARGILYGVRSLLMAEGRRMTQLDSIIASLAWPTLFVSGPRNRFRVVYGPNVVNYVPPGVTATTITPEIPAGPIQTALATIQAGIERGTFGSVIRGDKPPQTTSAAQLAILSGQARLRFGSIKIHLETALIEAYQKVAEIAKVVDAPLTLWQWDDTDAESPEALVIKPADWPERFVCHIEVLADPVEEQERRAQLGVFLWEKGIIDWEDAATRAGVADVKSMRRRIIRDKILFETPAVVQALGEQYILESGYDIESLTLEKTMRDLLILRSQQEMQATIFSPQGGAAGIPGNQPAAPSGFSPNQLGGRPGNTPTPASAMMSGMESA